MIIISPLAKGEVMEDVTGLLTTPKRAYGMAKKPKSYDPSVSTHSLAETNSPEVISTSAIPTALTKCCQYGLMAIGGLTFLYGTYR